MAKCIDCGAECIHTGTNRKAWCDDWEAKVMEKSCGNCYYLTTCDYAKDNSTLISTFSCEMWQPKQQEQPKIAGVGKDAETTTNEKGGKQSKVLYAFDALDPQSMFNMCKVLKEGRDKYGSDENWRKIPCREHLNHLLIHVFAYLAGDKSDEHLDHALCRAMFALGVDLADKEATK